MSKLLAKCLVNALDVAASVALYLWIGWWAVLVCAALPAFTFAARRL